MNRVQRNILIGSILGDGHLDKPTRNGSRWIIKYDDKFLPYLEWLHSKLLSLEVSDIKTKSGNYHQHYFFVKPSLEIGKWRSIFYPQGKKVVPAIINKLLTDSLSVAVWYMDDGSLDFREKYHFNATLATFCFSYEECLLLAKTLNLNFGVKAKVHKNSMRGKEYYRLYIKSESMDRFVGIIQRNIQPCMKYKISHDRNKISDMSNFIRHSHYQQSR